MNSEQITSVLRSILQFAGGLAVSRGFITGGELEIIIGIVASVVALGLSVWTRRSAKLAADAAKQPGVSVEVSDSETARAIIKAGAPAGSVSVYGGL